MAAPPTGTVTFLYTDIEGSTRLWEARPAAMHADADRHFALLRDAIGSHGGHVFRTQGDGLCAAFATAPPALAAALAAQLALHREPWPSGDAIRVRMALHTGAAEAHDGDYAGACLNRIGRLLGIGRGGQTLVSQTTYDLVRETLPGGAGLRDLGAHRLRDLTAPEQLFQLLHPELPDAFPPPNSLDARPNNLPLQVTSFVGRERELAEVRELLERSRLLTLTGTGGCGKTRLALQVAAELVDGYPDGVWFVDLAPLADRALVAAAALATLGAREVPGQEPLASLVEHLRARQLLLLLDNCEHVIDASARLGDALLRGCPAVRLLVTSRELLGVSGETAWPVPSLALPDPAAHHTAAELGRCESAQLFIDRALAVQPAFRVTEQNASALAQVCTRLDGIPLALELAAARVRVLTVEQIATRLSDRFRLLTGGGRTALRRQQTLRALVDWSHDLLSERERVLLRRLAVFAGGWTLEAAEAVGADGSGQGKGPMTIEPVDVLDLLTSLVDKSLVVADPGEVEERYVFLETIRQYAEEKLLQAGEAAALRDRHRDWCLAAARLIRPDVELTPETIRRRRQFVAELDNVRGALAWCAAGDAAAARVGLEIAANLQEYAWRRAELRAWLETLLTLVPERVAIRAWALLRLDHARRWQHEFVAGKQASEEALAIFLELGDEVGAADARSQIGLDLANLGDYAAARAYLDDSLAFARARGDHARIIRRTREIGTSALAEGDFGRARLAIEESVTLARRLGATELGAALGRLAMLDRLEGDYARARARVDEMRSLGLQNRGHHSVEYLLGNIERAEGRYAEARRNLAGVVQQGGQAGWGLELAEPLCMLGVLEVARGALARGVRIIAGCARGDGPIGTVHTPDVRVEAPAFLARAREGLGEAAYAAAWSEGQTMTLDEAAAHALEDTPAEPAAAPAGPAGVPIVSPNDPPRGE
jgi:predicted ATPase/class 3 adenylate cyclase